MQGLNAADFKFFLNVFHTYWGNITLVFVYLVAVLHAFRLRGIYKNVYAYSTVAALLTVFNPVFVYVLVNKLEPLCERYYRFYWIMPFAQLIAMFFVGEVRSCKKRKERFMAAAFVLLIILLGGNFNLYDRQESKANIYKINEEVFQITEIIHDYVPDQEEIHAYYDWSLLVEIRTYDISIHTPVGRHYVMEDGTFDMAWAEDNFLLLMIMEHDTVEFPVERVRSAFDEYGIECYIRQKTHFSDEYVNSLGLTLIGETEHYEVYWYQ